MRAAEWLRSPSTRRGSRCGSTSWMPRARKISVVECDDVGREAVMRAVILALCAGVFPVSAQVLSQHYRLNIPREPLDAALKDFARQTNLQIARFSDTVDGSVIVGPVAG